MSENKKEIVKQMTDLEFHPEIVDIQKAELHSFNRFSMSEMVALGTAFAPIVNSLQGVVANSSASASQGLFRVVLPKGATHLAQFKNKSGMLGAAFDGNNRLVGQAQLFPANGIKTAMNFNPYMMVMAVSLMCISKKLDTISKTQEDILAFLEQKERAEQIGNLNFLSESLNNYKYNWDNEQYRDHHHNQVLEIKRNSEQKIAFYRPRVESFSGKLNGIHASWDVDAKKKELITCLSDYGFAVYLFAFSSYVEVLLLENFEEAYLNRIINRIHSYSLEYREVFSNASISLEKFSKDSIGAGFMRGVGGISKAFGSFASNVPLFKNAQIDKGLVQNGENLEKIEKDRNQTIVKEIAARKNVDVSAFLENLQMINTIHNNPVQILFDSNNIYLSASH